MAEFKIPEAGRKRWAEELARVVSDNASSREAFAAKFGFSTRTLDSWVKGAVTPTLGALWQWHELGLFPMADQVQTLFGLSAEEMQPTVPVWQPRAALSELLAGLRAVIGEATKAEPDAADFVAALHESCRATRDYGRWQTRTFDVAVGWHFPFHGFEAIEFTKHELPNQSTDHSIEKSLSFVHDHPMPEDYFLSHVGAVLRDPQPHKSFWPGVPEVERYELWERFRLERFELMGRIIEQYKASRGDMLGGVGTLGRCLLPNPDDGGGNHLLMLPTTPRIPTTGELQVRAGKDVRLIVLVGPGSLALNRLAMLVGDAIGWHSMSSRLLAHKISGHRASQGRNVPVTNRRVLQYLLNPPPMTPPMVISFGHFYLREGRNKAGYPIPLDEATQLLRTPGVLPVFLSHPEESETADLWQLRKAYNRGNGIDSLGSERHHWRADFDAWEGYAGDTPGSILAEVLPTILHAGPAMGQFKPTDRARWYTHPTVGDINLRVAYEIAVTLRRGMPVQAAPRNLRGVGFTPHSVIGVYRKDLADCTGGEYWQDPPDWQEYNSIYENHPGEGVTPVRARVVNLQIT